MFEVRPEQTGFIFLLGKHAAFDFFDVLSSLFFFFVILFSFPSRSGLLLSFYLPCLAFMFLCKALCHFII